MASVCVCERCSAIVKGGAVAELYHRATTHVPNVQADLCPDCFVSFLEWLTAEPQAKRASYSEPYKVMGQMGPKSLTEST
jgi:hypothetical protein